MTRLRSIGALLACLSVWYAAPGCGAQSKGEGSESHFVRCHSDPDCADAGATFVCIDGYCAKPSSEGGTGVSMTKADVGPPPPDACAVATTEPGPYAVTFVLENPSGTPLGISPSGGCKPRYTVTSCADGYQRSLVLSPPCGAICPALQICTDGACYEMAQTVDSNAADEEQWPGYEYIQRTMPVQCSDQLVAKAGKYRITVPVFAPGSSVSMNPLYSVSADFSLPATNGTVHIPIAPASTAGDGNAPPEAGACTPVLGRQYEASRDCYDGQVSTGACLYESSPGTTSGVTEISCLIAPDGARYAIVKGYTQCLDTASVRAGYSVKGGMGLCEHDIGATPIDQACSDAVSRGDWTAGPLGSPITLDLSADAGGLRGDLVGECR